MPLAEAMAIVPLLHAEPYDSAADRQALESLAAECRQFSPLVGLEDAAAPDCLFLDITGLEHLFGGEASLAQSVLSQCSRRSLWARIAIADTLGAAWAVAHYAHRLHKDAEEGLPLAIVPSGETLAALRPLPIESLRLSDDVVELLHPLGIRKVEQFESLPRTALLARFGPELTRRWDQATGLLAEPVPSLDAAPEYRAELSFEYPTTRQDALDLAIERLIRQVAETLLRADRGAMRLDVRLTCQATAIDLSVGMFRPTASPQHLLGLMRMRLERLRLPSPVTAVAIEAAITAPLDRRQEELFAAKASSGSQQRRLAGLIDCLASRLGLKAVLCPRFFADAQPEYASRYVPLIGSRPAAKGTKQKSTDRKAGRHATTVWDSPPRPLRLLRAPAPVVAVSVMPDGPPVRFVFRGEEHRVARVWGPERIETGWWRGAMIARDYYRVETAAGRRYWLFRGRNDGDWFLHGLFD